MVRDKAYIAYREGGMNKPGGTPPRPDFGKSFFLCISVPRRTPLTFFLYQFS